MSRILNELGLEELRTKLAAIFERRSSDEERCRIRMRQLPDGKRSVWIPPPMRTNLTRQSHGEGEF